MTELFKKPRKLCFWSLLTQALNFHPKILPEKLLFEDYKLLTTQRKVEKTNAKILRKTANRCTENTYFMEPLFYA